MRSPMLGAKLFFLAGLFFLVAGAFWRPTGLPSIDINLHATYFVVGHFHFLFLSSLALWAYASLYYLGARLFALNFNTTLTILHLLVMTVGLIALNSLRYLGIYWTGQSPVSPLVIRLATLGGALFLLGFAMFVVIVILAALAKVRRATA